MADGSYAQVNGDVVEVINKSRVEFSLPTATGTRRGEGERRPSRRPPASAVPVLMKKRRRIVLPPEG